MGDFQPFALPLHPAVVHFPIAMLSAAWFCLLARHATGSPQWAVRAGLFEIVGVAALPFVIAAGLIDTRGIDFVTHPRWSGPLIWHVIVALTGAALFASHWWWRRRVVPEPRGAVAVAELVAVTAALWLLVAAALIASEMVYAR